MSGTLIENTRFGALRRNLLRKMVQAQVFKFGQFELKSGQVSPIYIDLRECFGYPDLLMLISESIAKLVEKAEINYRGIVGVPYAALPYASVVAGQFLKKPLLITRKEAKSYGTKKMVEGLYANGDEMLIIEDVVTTGTSIGEVVNILNAEGVLAPNVFCILDREQGGRQYLNTYGINLHSLLNMETVLTFLYSVGCIQENQWHEVVQALNLPYASAVKLPISFEMEDLNKLPYVDAPRTGLRDKESLTTSPLNKKVLDIMRKKKSNLCLAIDYTTTEKILQLAERAGPFVVAIKVHADVIEDFSEEFTKQLITLANDLEFVIFEDRKFADTGKTTQLQLNGYQKIATWADVVTVHAVQGADSISGVFREFINDPKYRLSGILLIAQLSTKGSLTDIEGYTQQVAKIADENRDVVSGFIAQTRISSFSDLLNWTPGVNLDVKTDDAGQQWRGVDEAIENQQNDIVIVGRGVTASAEPVQQLKRYREVAWEVLSKNDESLLN